MDIVLQAPLSFSSIPRTTAMAKRPIFQSPSSSGSYSDDICDANGARSLRFAYPEPVTKNQHAHAATTDTRFTKTVVKSVVSLLGFRSIHRPSKEEKHIEAVVVMIPLEEMRDLSRVLTVM